MNCSIYFFGELGQGYTQSPDDGTRNLLETFFAKGQKGSRLSFVHEGKLAYYGYTRPLKAQGTYSGICCVFNDVFCDDYKSLFSLFEEAITYLVVEGKVLGFDESGDVVPVVERLYQASAEISRASDRIIAQLQRMESAFVKLPPVNYATASAATRVYSLDDNQWSIVEDMEKYPRVDLTKEIETDALASYAGQLKTLHEENTQLDKELQKVKAQKKRTTTVVILLIVLLLAGLALYRVITQSNEQQEAIKGLQESLYELQEDYSNMEVVLRQTEDSLEVTQGRYDSLSDTHQLLQRALNGLLTIPFVTGASHSGNNDTSFDKAWSLWLQALAPVKIESFYVKANKSGSLTLGLYDVDGYVVDTTIADVKENQFKRILPSGFIIDTSGYYYLAIHSNPNDIELSYHNGGEDELSSKHGALRVVGSSSKGKSRSEIKKSYYQYFYDIVYRLR